MSYWKGLMIAVAIDLVWIMGSPATATGPEPYLTTKLLELPAPVVEQSRVAELEVTSDRVDSLMLHLQQNSEDVAAMEQVAEIYMGNEWFEAAIGPLARALQIDPTRRSLWVALDRAVEKSGRGKVSDGELASSALDFVEAVKMWGHGC